MEKKEIGTMVVSDYKDQFQTFIFLVLVERLLILSRIRWASFLFSSELLSDIYWYELTY